MPSHNERVHRSHPRSPVWAEQALGVPQPMFFTHKAWSEVEAMPFSYSGVGIWEAEGATKWAVVTWERTNTKSQKTMQIHHQINGSWMKREIPEGGQEQSQQGRRRKAESGVIPYFKETAAGICVCTHTCVHACACWHTCAQVCSKYWSLWIHKKIKCVKKSCKDPYKCSFIIDFCKLQSMSFY